MWIVTSCLVALLAMVALLATAGPSRADVIPDAITSISTTATHVDEGDQVTFTCEWAVPDGSSPGDTFDLTLPEQLKWVGSRTFDLRAPDRSVVATAVVDDSGHVIFTLGDYVASHTRDVHGTCTFVTLYSTEGTGEQVDLEFQTGSEVIRVPVGTDEPCTSNCTGTRDDAGKDMWWLDAAQTTTRSVVWTPATTADSTTVTITDIPAPGLALDCDTVEPHIGRQLSAQGKLTAPYDDDALPATVTCTPDRLVVQWSSAPAGEYAEVRVNAVVTRAAQDTYANAAVVSFDGTDTAVDSTVIRTDASGTGSGQVPPSTTTSTTSTSSTTSTTSTSPTSSTTSTTSSPTPTSPTPTRHVVTDYAAPTQGPSLTASPTVATGGGDAGALAYTGSDLLGIAAVAVLFLTFGAGLLVAARPRGSHQGR